jgi:hypothetical protein
MPQKLETRLLDEAAREGVDASTLVVRALEQRFGSTTPATLQAREAELLLQIGEGPSEAVWRRYRELSGRRDAESLTSEEHEELIGLSKTIEAADVTRLEHMVELAKLRGVDLRTLRTQLGIPKQDFSDGQNNA